MYFHFLECILGTVLKDLRSIRFFGWVFLGFLPHKGIFEGPALLHAHG